MSSKVFCDVCGIDMGGQQTLEPVTIRGMLNPAVFRRVRVELIPGDNDGDVCNDCTLDALYTLRTPLLEADLKAEEPRVFARRPRG